MRIICLALVLLAGIVSAPAMAAKPCPVFESWDTAVVIEDWQADVILPQVNDDPQCWDAP